MTPEQTATKELVLDKENVGDEKLGTSKSNNKGNSSNGAPLKEDVNVNNKTTVLERISNVTFKRSDSCLSLPNSTSEASSPTSSQRSYDSTSDTVSTAASGSGLLDLSDVSFSQTSTYSSDDESTTIIDSDFETFLVDHFGSTDMSFDQELVDIFDNWQEYDVTPMAKTSPASLYK